MKKTICILVMCIATNALAQNSFPTENAIWNESIRNSYFIYGLLGDTIFNEVTYSKLYQFCDTVLLEENRCGYVGAFRNEGQKVFLKPAIWEHPDILLYDFGAEVGDIVWHNAVIPSYGSYYDIQPCSDCYSFINSVTIDENNRKIYDIHCWDGNWFDSWYEEIGSNRGILFSLPKVISVNDSYEDFQLNCFKHNDTVKYLNYDYPCNKCFCQQIGIEDIELNTNFIKIYPNPTKDILNIEILDNSEIKSINIYNIEGKLIEKNMYKFSKEQINLSRLNAGNYIISIETEKGNFNQIIIKN